MTTKERLILFLTHLNISQGRFEKKVGLSIGFVNKVGDSIRKSSLEKIISVYPQLNTAWLLTGVGEMLDKDSTQTNKAETGTEIITKRVPLVNQYAYVGYLTRYKDQDYIDQLPKIPFDSEDDPNFRYMAFEMKGNSMDDGSRDSYIEGDKLFCQEIPSHMWDTSKLHTMNWNFVIVYKKGIIVRKIIDHDIQNRTIVAHPLNPFINDELINLVDVYQIFHVLEYLRKN